MDGIKKLTEIRKEYGDYFFLENFFAWLENHDDEDITCMTDVVDTLIEDMEEDLQNGI